MVVRVVRNLNLQIYKINPFIYIYSILFVIVFLILINQLQLNTMRHLLFIIPFLFFISNHSFQTVFEIFLFRKNFLKKFFNIGFVLILMALFTSSIYSSYFRLDPLKVYKLPKEIIEFQINQTNNYSITEVTGGLHYLYNSFTKCF